MKLSAVVIAKNEAHQIAECLEGLLFCDEVVVVDSGSVDRTVQIARDLGARVIERPFDNFADQKNAGVAAASGEWVLLVDADERVSPDLAAEIRKTLEAPRARGYWVLRHNRIFGRWMRHGMSAEDWHLRLARKDSAVFEGWVHERVRLSGPSSRLRCPLSHLSTPDISTYMKKLNVYTGLEAKILLDRKTTAPRPGLRRAFLIFSYWAFLKKGVLDGLEGFLFCVLSAYYDLVKQFKHWELLRRDPAGEKQA
jgi:glycosyltransferase involved in cell wall biosynthesis